MKRRSFLSTLAAICAAPAALFASAQAKPQPLLVRRPNESTAEVTGDPGTLIQFLHDWQDDLWPGWKSDTKYRTSTMRDYEANAKAGRLVFHVKGKPWDRAFHVALGKHAQRTV